MPYCARNQIGALVHECSLVFSSLAHGGSISDIRKKALDGELFSQKARTSRERFWSVINYRYLSRPPWIISEICESVCFGERSPGFLSLLQIHYILRDSLTLRLIEDFFWKKWLDNDLVITPAELMRVIQKTGAGHIRIERLTEASLKLLAQMILSSLRDFGLLEGKVKKRIVKPVISPSVVCHLLRILHDEGLAGEAIVSDSSWRMFMLSPEDVSHHLYVLSQRGIIRFERTGTTTVLITPASWNGKEHD
jgi:DNA-binding transcriptional ArsR family regulator